jgi:hypothetical protein
MGRTSIPCTEQTLARLKDEKPDTQSWDEFLQHLVEDGNTPETPTELEDRVTELERRVSEIESLASRR